MVTVKLPLDVAWEKALFHANQDMIGATVIRLNVGRGTYVLIANNIDAEHTTFHAAVEMDNGGKGILRKNVQPFTIAGHFYIGLQVETADDANTIFALLDTAERTDMDTVTALNYIDSVLYA